MAIFGQKTSSIQANQLIYRASARKIYGQETSASPHSPPPPEQNWSLMPMPEYLNIWVDNSKLGNNGNKSMNQSIHQGGNYKSLPLIQTK